MYTGKELLLALLFLLVLPASASGQTPASDASGDVQLDILESYSQPNTPGADHIDLTSISVIETDESFVFTAELVDLSSDPGTGFLVEAFLSHGLLEYRIVMYGQLDTPPEEATLYQRPQGVEDWDVLGEIPVVVDASASTITFTADRNLLVDEDQAIPFPGRQLSNVFLTASTRVTQVQVTPGAHPVIASWSDRLPDEGGIIIDVTNGVEQVGDIILGSPRPTRGSNGEATQYVFEITATNKATSAREMTFETTHMPARWDVAYAKPLVRIEPDETVTVPAIVSVPFSHEHGSIEEVQIEAVDVETGQRSGSIVLSVNFYEVPQPSGHHGTVYLHSLGGGDTLRGANTQTWINTLEEDPGSTAQPVRGHSTSLTGAGSNVYHWCFRLQPALGVGIAADPTATGLATMQFSSEGPISMTQVDVAVQLRFPTGEPAAACEGTSDLTIAEGGLQEEHALGQPTTLKIPLLPNEAATHIPTELGTAFYIEVTATTALEANPLDAAAPTIEPHASFDLPLLDFHDAVPIEAGNVFEFTHNHPDSIERAPGAIAVLELVASEDIDVRLVSQPDWATRADACSSCATIVIQVPENAQRGDRMDLIVIGEGASSTYLSKFEVIVNPDADETDPLPQGEAEDSPGVAVVGPAVILAGAAWRSAARRQQISP